MILFCDNDIIHKLAACDLLDDATRLFGVSPQDVCVLPTAKYKFGIKKGQARATRKLGREIFARICRFLASVSEIEDFSRDEQLLLEDILDIEQSDTILITATANHEEYFLATGDKRCLKALISCQRCRPIAERLRGHVVCLEQIIRRAIELLGFEYVKRRVVPAACCDPACDTSLRAAFGSGLDATEENVVRSLDSRIRELRLLDIDMLAGF